MKKWLFDFILGLVMLLICIALLIYSWVLESGWIDTYFLARPDVYVALWVGILALLSIMLILRALRLRKTPQGQERLAPIWTSPAVWTVAILGLYILLLNKLGFVLDSIWMLWVMTFIYSMNAGETKKDWHDRKLVLRELIKSGLLAVVCSVVIYLVFTKLLSSRLPSFDLF